MAACRAELIVSKGPAKTKKKVVCVVTWAREEEKKTIWHTMALWLC